MGRLLRFEFITTILSEECFIVSLAGWSSKEHSADDHFELQEQSGLETAIKQVIEQRMMTTAEIQEEQHPLKINRDSNTNSVEGM